MSGFSIPSRGSHLTDCLSEGGGALEGRFSSSSTNTRVLVRGVLEGGFSSSSTNTNSKSTSSTSTSSST